MLNKILWTLDNETSPKLFERLCVDLLFRHGYTNIVPVGGVHDRGRDAEASAQGTDSTGKLTFFQFSLQKNWRQKLRSELRKVSAEGHQIASFIFVTNQETSGRDRDLLRELARDKYGWELTILSREWLRLQLEEANPDLAHKYFGIQLPDSSHRFEVPFHFARSETADSERAWTFFDAGDFDRASVELKHYLRTNPGNAGAWEALAWCQYELFRYDEALASINRALDINPRSRQTKSIRGCILAERGIHQGDRQSVKEANRIFATLLPDPRGILHYNYGNTLAALSQYEEAARQYRIATELTPGDARIWKNLATAYHELGDHEKEMECFDRAIALDPQQPQALASKGVSLLVDFGRAEEAIELMERAIAVDSDLSIRWPHIWYWLGEACRQVKRYHDALRWVEAGLRQAPGHVWLRKLRFVIFAEEWREQPTKASTALEFFSSELADNPLDYSARTEVVKIHESTGRMDEAWSVLGGAFGALGIDVDSRIKEAGFSLDECATALEHLPAYLAFRRAQPVREYWNIDDPTYLLSETPPNDRSFEERLLVYCALVFGLARDELAGIAVEERESPEVAAIFGRMRVALERVVPLAARAFAAWVGEEAEPRLEVISHRMAITVLFLPVVALREWGAQHGWLATTFALSEALKERAIESLVAADMDETVMVEALRELYALAEPVLAQVREKQRDQ